MDGRVRAVLGCALVIAACGGSGGRGGGGQPIAYDCRVFPPAASSPYILPWVVGHTYEVRPHAARETGPQRYAIDVLMPIGTDVVASRPGVVVRVEESFQDSDNTSGHENFVFIRHEDATIARYVHLTNMGALVQLGDSVQRGQHIGVSGNTGNSTAPHLHFDVIGGCPNNDLSLTALCETNPLNFSNAQQADAASGATDLSCGLRVGVWYRALPP